MQINKENKCYTISIDDMTIGRTDFLWWLIVFWFYTKIKFGIYDIYFSLFYLKSKNKNKEAYLIYIISLFFKWWSHKLESTNSLNEDIFYEVWFLN